MDEQRLENREQVQVKQMVDDPVPERGREHFPLQRPVDNEADAPSNLVTTMNDVFEQLDQIEREVPLEAHLCIGVPLVLSRIEVCDEKVRQQPVTIWILGGDERGRGSSYCCC